MSPSPQKKRKKRRSSKSGRIQRPRSPGSIAPSSTIATIVDDAGAMQDVVIVNDVVPELSVAKPPVKKARTVRGIFIFTFLLLTRLLD